MGLFALIIVLLIVVMISMAVQSDGNGVVAFGAVGIAIGAVVTLIVVVPSFLIALALMTSLTDVDPAQPGQPG